jgi:acyl transferase domain-containing protein
MYANNNDQVICSPIYAVIRGTAMNQDGRTNGINAPSRKAQEDLLEQAYAKAGVQGT